MTHGPAVPSPLPRLTASVRQQLLDQNEGLTFHTTYRDRNSREVRTYTVKGGELLINAQGKGPFGGSQFNTDWVADSEQVHRTLYDHQRRFDHSRVDPTLRLPKPEAIVIDIPNDVAEGLVEGASTEAQSRVVAWFHKLSPKEKLILGGVVVAVVAGGVVVYRFRQPISEQLRGAAMTLRRKFDRRSIPQAHTDEDDSVT